MQKSPLFKTILQPGRQGRKTGCPIFATALSSLRWAEAPEISPNTKPMPGPLRVGRSLRDAYIPFGVRLPLVACEDVYADQREATAKPVYASRSDRPTRSGPARQRLSFIPKGKNMSTRLAHRRLRKLPHHGQQQPAVALPQVGRVSLDLGQKPDLVLF